MQPSPLSLELFGCRDADLDTDAVVTHVHDDIEVLFFIASSVIAVIADDQNGILEFCEFKNVRDLAAIVCENSTVLRFPRQPT